MTHRKREFVPLWSIFQTKHGCLATVILVCAIILVGMFPLLLLPIFIGACLVGIVGVCAVISGLVDINREALELHAASDDELYAKESRASPDSVSINES